MKSVNDLDDLGIVCRSCETNLKLESYLNGCVGVFVCPVCGLQINVKVVNDG